jgi:hypothetical protein
MVRNVTHTYTETKGLVRIQEGGLVGAVPSIPHTTPCLSYHHLASPERDRRSGFLVVYPFLPMCFLASTTGWIALLINAASCPPCLIDHN